jgi:glycosyltransferase involved in cell wall biosynthesis
MKVLLTLDFPPEHGGMQRYLWGIVQHCYESNDCVLYGGTRFDSAAYHDLQTPVQPASWWLSSINKKFSIPVLFFTLLRLIKSSKGISVECGNVYAGIAAWLAGLITGVKYRVYTYGTELVSLNNSSIHAKLLRSVLQKAELLYVLGPYTKGLLEKAKVTTATEIVPPRIELPEFNRDFTAGSWESGSSLTVLCVGRLVPHKGQHILIDALALLPQHMVSKAIVIGDGPSRKSLETQCSQKVLSEKVQFMGEVSDAQLDELYRSASVLVFPSLETSTGTEGFGIVLLEAMAFSIPVIASRIGGIPEVLAQGECGLLVSPGDPQSLAEALKHMHDNIQLRQSLVLKARERMIKHYVW